MPPKKRARTQKVPEKEGPMIEERTEVSRETERQNVEDQIEEGERVKLLKDRVAQGDTEAMLLLAECYALGRETKQDRTQAEALISSSAKKGNSDAKSLVRLLKKWKKETTMDMTRLLSKSNRYME